MKKLIHMWKYPRMVSWFLASILLFLLARLPFIAVPVITYTVEFQPGYVLVPLLGIFWGPAGALGITVGSLLGDWLFGLWGPLAVFRAVGLFLAAYSAKKLWDFSTEGLEQAQRLRPSWSQTLRFLYVSWPGCFLAASWVALGAETLRLYPFAYIVLLVLLNNLIFTTVLGPALYRILARELVPHFGCWREVMGEAWMHPIIGSRGALANVVGGIGAVVVGFLAGGFLYGHWPLRATVAGEMSLGSWSGPALVWLVIPFFVAQVAGLLWPRGLRPPSLFNRDKRGSRLASAVNRV